MGKLLSQKHYTWRKVYSLWRSVQWLISAKYGFVIFNAKKTIKTKFLSSSYSIYFSSKYGNYEGHVQILMDKNRLRPIIKSKRQKTHYGLNEYSQLLIKSQSRRHAACKDYFTCINVSITFVCRLCFEMDLFIWYFNFVFLKESLKDFMKSAFISIS